MEEHRLRVFENRVLRRIFGPKRDKVTGEWRELHNVELNILYSSPNIIRQIKSRRMRWAGHVAEERNAYRLLMGKPQGKRPLRRSRRRWVDGIRIDLREIGWGSVDWIRLAQDRDRWRALVNTMMNLWVLATRSLLVSYERLLVPVAARSKSQVLAAWVVESWVRMSMGVWMFINIVYILCCLMSVESFATS
jgi:hypothetical protein